jgi:hypothetical protein
MQISKDLLEKFKSMKKAELDELGREVNSPIPKFEAVVPAPLSITDQIKRLMSVELGRQAAAQGMESFEESDDFEDEEFDDAPETEFQKEPVMRPEWPGPKGLGQRAYSPHGLKQAPPPSPEGDSEDDADVEPKGSTPVPSAKPKARPSKATV